jgi:hypothetical protein
MEETALGVIPNLRKHSFLGTGPAYTLVVTDRRLVFAQLTKQMLKDAAAAAQQQAKAEGKGFFSRWGDQFQAVATLHKKYLGMPADSILAETAGNFAIENTAVLGVSITDEGDSGSDAPSKPRTKVKLKTGTDTLHLDADQFRNEWVDLLRSALGERVTCKAVLFT